MESYEEFKWLSEYAPCFEVDSNNIEILQTPSEFYEKLKSMFSESKTRISISSLYLGTGKLEEELVDSIEIALKNSENVKVKVMLDHSRGLRGTHNSKTMLENLYSKYASQFQLYFYHTPKLRGIPKRVLPHRYNETLGVLHMKIYMADDTLIISGANLSNDYFVNRQDRYIVINNCPKLCDFMDELIEAISKSSFCVNQNGHLEYDNHHHPFNGDHDTFLNNLEETVRDLYRKYMAQNERNDDTRDQTAYIYPLVQIPDSKFVLDEVVIQKIFEFAPKQSTINLATGYFNLTNDFENCIISKSSADFNLLISSPEANGFFTATGAAGSIPKMYSHYEELFYKRIEFTSQLNRIKINEYQRDEWTYHAKGLWYCQANNTTTPILTVIGSSNFSYRSMHRDLEAQLVIYTKNANLQQRLHNEKENLFKDSTPVTQKTFLPIDRHVSMRLRILSKIIRSYF